MFKSILIHFSKGIRSSPSLPGSSEQGSGLLGLIPAWTLTAEGRRVSCRPSKPPHPWLWDRAASCTSLGCQENEWRYDMTPKPTCSLEAPPKLSPIRTHTWGPACFHGTGAGAVEVLHHPSRRITESLTRVGEWGLPWTG